jgi:hypothetical protein
MGYADAAPREEHRAVGDRRQPGPGSRSWQWEYAGVFPNWSHKPLLSGTEYQRSHASRAVARSVRASRYFTIIGV